MSQDASGLAAKSALISSDSHVSEPPDLWTSRLGKTYGTRVPHVVANGGATGIGGDWLIGEGILSFPLGMGNIGAFPRTERMARLTGFDFHRDAPRAAYDGTERAAALDADGVSAEIIYPWYAARVLTMRDAELQSACLDVSNEWLAEFCAASPKRLYGVPVIALHDPKAAVDALHRALARGLKGAMILAVPPPEIPFSSSHYERFWAAAAEARVPVSLHALPPRETDHAVQRRRASTVENRVMGLIEDYHLANVLFDHAIQCSLAQIILSGVLERHPALRLVVNEWGTGWIPTFLANLDYTVETRPELLPITMRPSEYFARQIHVSFDRALDLPDAVVARLEANLMWASDYPHVETSWPESRAAFREYTAAVSDAARSRLAWENCAKLYDLDVEGILHAARK